MGCWPELLLLFKLLFTFFLPCLLSLFPRQYILEFISFSSVSLNEKHFLVLRNKWARGPDDKNSGLPAIVLLPNLPPLSMVTGVEIIKPIRSQILVVVLVALVFCYKNKTALPHKLNYSKKYLLNKFCIDILIYSTKLINFI